MQCHSRVVLNAKAADHALRIERNFRSGSVERERRVGRVHILLAADGDATLHGPVRAPRLRKPL